MCGMAQFKYANENIETNIWSKLDKLGLIIRNLLQNSDFDRQSNIYETMLNSGELKLLRNHDGIRKLEEKCLYTNKMENIHYDANMSQVVQAINTAIKFSTGQIQKPNLYPIMNFKIFFLEIIQLMQEKDQVILKQSFKLIA